MFPCPHCGEPIDNESTDAAPWYGNEPRGSQVSLGCGTLILIALIVIIFSGGNDNSDAIESLRTEIQSLEQKIDRLAEQQPRAEPR